MRKTNRLPVATVTTQRFRSATSSVSRDMCASVYLIKGSTYCTYNCTCLIGCPLNCRICYRCSTTKVLCGSEDVKFVFQLLHRLGSRLQCVSPLSRMLGFVHCRLNSRK